MCSPGLDRRSETTPATSLRTSELLTKRRAVDLCRVATCLCHSS